MTDLHQASTPNPNPGIDAVGWLFFGRRLSHHSCRCGDCFRLNAVKASFTMRIVSGGSRCISANALSKSSGSRTPKGCHSRIVGIPKYPEADFLCHRRIVYRCDGNQCATSRCSCNNQLRRYNWPLDHRDGVGAKPNGVSDCSLRDFGTCSDQSQPTFRLGARYRLMGVPL